MNESDQWEIAAFPEEMSYTGAEINYNFETVLVDSNIIRGCEHH